MKILKVLPHLRTILFEAYNFTAIICVMFYFFDLLFVAHNSGCLFINFGPAIVIGCNGN